METADIETADIIRAIEVIYDELKAGKVRNAGLSLEILLDDLNGQNPKVSDLSFFRHWGVRDEYARVEADPKGGEGGKVSSAVRQPGEPLQERAKRAPHHVQPA